MMERTPELWSEAVLDVLVVGAGIHGAAIAFHAARAGYRVALVDKGDFSSATSANSLKILHGGFRYLQHGNLKRMRHSIVSRREMMQLAPWLVRPLPCLMPLYGGGITRNRTLLTGALWVNHWIGRDRNRGLDPALHLPRGEVLGPEACLEAAPGISTAGLRGGLVWYDVLALDTERLVLEYIHRAAAAGAVAANYLEVTSIDEAGDHYRVRMLDHRTGTGIRARSRFVVNAAGPWFAGSVFPGTDRERSRSWALAVNLVTPKQFFPGCGVALEGEQGYRDADALVKRDKRLFFFVPWRGHTMIGTLYEPWPHGPDRLRVEPAILQRMIDGINAIHPAARLGMNDISFYHAGLLPMRGGQADGGVQLEKESALVTPGEGEAKRLLSVRSVKYTTAPVVAREAVALLQRRLPPSVSPVPMEQTRSSDDREVPETLRLRYGPRAGRVGRYEEGEPDPWIDRRNGISRAEIRYLVAEEMAWRLEDIVFRRTGMGTAACPERETLSRAAACMGELLGWDAERRAGEVRRVLRRYAPLPCGDDGGKKEETR